MSNRTARHQRPGQKNLRGKKRKSFCPCCDDVINHRDKIIAAIHKDEVAEGHRLAVLLGTAMRRNYDL